MASRARATTSSRRGLHSAPDRGGRRDRPAQPGRRSPEGRAGPRRRCRVRVGNGRQDGVRQDARRSGRRHGYWLVHHGLQAPRSSGRPARHHGPHSGPDPPSTLAEVVQQALIAAVRVRRCRMHTCRRAGALSPAAAKGRPPARHLSRYVAPVAERTLPTRLRKISDTPAPRRRVLSTYRLHNGLLRRDPTIK